MLIIYWCLQIIVLKSHKLYVSHWWFYKCVFVNSPPQLLGGFNDKYNITSWCLQTTVCEHMYQFACTIVYECPFVYHHLTFYKESFGKHPYTTHFYFSFMNNCA